MLDTSELETYRSLWKRSKTTPRGFFKSYRAESHLGDIFQVDFNFHENLVRLTLEPASEKGRSYTSTIKRGTIIRERDVFNGVNASLRRKFYPFKDVFSCVPDEDIISTIGGVYDISRVSLGKRVNEPVVAIAEEKVDLKTGEKKDSLWTRFQKSYVDLRERIVDDIYDSILGTSLCVAIYLHFFDYVVLGFSLGFMGIFFGGLDWLVRNRTPFYLKVLSFMVFGSYYFYTGYTRF